MVIDMRTRKDVWEIFREAGRMPCTYRRPSRLDTSENVHMAIGPEGYYVKVLQSCLPRDRYKR